MNKNKNTLIIFFISLFDGAALSMVFTTLLPLLLSPSNHFYPLSSSHETRRILLGLVLAMMPIGQFFGSPIWGNLADKFGRKKTLLATVFGSSIGLFITAFSIATTNLSLLLIGRLITGLMASNIAIGQASLADTHQHKKRTGSFNIQQIAIGLGLGFGPGIATYVARNNHVALPFTLMAIIYLGLVFFVWRSFQETFQAELAKKLSINLNLIISTLKNKNTQRGFFVYMIFMLGWSLYFQFSSVFWISQYHISNAQLSHVFLFLSIAALSAQVLLVQPLAHYVKPSTIIPWSILLIALSFIALAFTSFGLSFYLFLGLYCIGIAFFMTNVMTYISLSASANKQGSVLGLVVSSQALMNLIITLIGGSIISFFPKAPFILSGLIILISLIVWKVCNNRFLLSQE
jgi:MFS transporter, DHA1 family, tetracycline resistance protein